LDEQVAGLLRNANSMPNFKKSHNFNTPPMTPPTPSTPEQTRTSTPISSASRDSAPASPALSISNGNEQSQSVQAQIFETSSDDTAEGNDESESGNHLLSNVCIIDAMIYCNACSL
jgi:hypothetical protein